ncbi:hypothetical protein ABMA28_010275 [Loxostege sticticalis]|uniref:Uncharacterized protein n=1 Tax=Loxostege sticticalis TaxID=481309 RepID=A0ABD0SCF3_LOXSC
MDDLNNGNCLENRRKDDSNQSKVGADIRNASEVPGPSGCRPSRVPSKTVSRGRASSTTSTSSSTSGSSSNSSNSSRSSWNAKAYKKRRSRRRHRRYKKRGGHRKSKDDYQLELLSRQVSELRKQLADNEQRNRVSSNASHNDGHCSSAVDHNCSDLSHSAHFDRESDILVDDNVSGILYDGVEETATREPDQSQLQFSFDFETKLKEPAVPKTPELFLKILQDVQHFDKKEWCEVRYSEVQKLYNHTPGFIDLEANDEIRSYDQLRHLAYADKAYSALTFCVLKQNQALQTSLNELLMWARSAEHLTVESLHEKINDLFCKGDVSKISSDMLQLVCGHRAEVIQMRRDGITNFVRDPLMKSTLRKIPPSNQNLFNAEAFTSALEKIGGVKKAFMPLTKQSSSGPGSQPGTSKAAARHPSQGLAYHYTPSQGTSHGYAASAPHPHYTHTQASQACCHNRPSQGHYSTVERRPSNIGRGSFHPRGGTRQTNRYQGQGKANRKRPGPPADQNSGGKKRKY